MFSRVLVVVAVCGLVACGDDGTGEGEKIDPAGTNTTYVISDVALPNNASEATTLGLDIDDKPNDGVDNQLGMLLASIRSLAPGLDLQSSIDAQIDRGTTILLADVKATNLENAPGVGLWIYEGDPALVTPAACTDLEDAVCRKHLTGTGMFAVKEGGVSDARLVGKIVAGTYTGGPGNITIQLGAIPLVLQRVKAQVVVSASGFGSGSKLGGAISHLDIQTALIPGLHTTILGIIERDCKGAPTPPTCGCTPSSGGADALGFLDTDANCEVTLAEATATFSAIITEDIDLNGDGMNDALSIGLGIGAVAGTFTVPPQS